MARQERDYERQVQMAKIIGTLTGKMKAVKGVLEDSKKYNDNIPVDMLLQWINESIEQSDREFNNLPSVKG